MFILCSCFPVRINSNHAVFLPDLGRAPLFRAIGPAISHGRSRCDACRPSRPYEPDGHCARSYTLERADSLGGYLRVAPPGAKTAAQTQALAARDGPAQPISRNRDRFAGGSWPPAPPRRCHLPCARRMARGRERMTRHRPDTVAAQNPRVPPKAMAFRHMPLRQQYCQFFMQSIYALAA